MKNNSRPIGIFDSGLGGLTVFSHLQKLLPHEDLIYLGDNARVPYGNRSKETVIKFSFEDTDFLLSKNIKCLVIACNTSSALAGDELKKKLKIPVFDVISPALKDAHQISENGKIAVIATRGTIGSGAYKVPFAKACPLLVPFIEEGETDSDALKLVLKNYLSEIIEFNPDTLILGCTHYPIIKHLIESELDKKVKIVDPGESVAGELKEFLVNNYLLNNQSNIGTRNYFVTDYTDRFIKVAEMFLGHKIEHNLTKVQL